MSDNLILPAATTRKISRRGVIAACTLVSAILFAGWHWASEQGLMDSISGSSPPVTPLPSTASASRPIATSSSALSPASSLGAKKVEDKQAMQEIAPTVSLSYAGNLGVITELKAKLQELKLEVELEEQRKRLEKLRQPEPTIVSLPTGLAGSMGASELLASLKPPLTSGTFSDPIVSSTQAETSNSVRLISVQASGDMQSATVATPAGAVTVQQGDPLFNSSVRRIADDAVTLTSGRRITW